MKSELKAYMKIVIINGSARGNALTAIDAFIKGHQKE